MMALSGKLTIGFLQEDNPVKAYFRFKPAYTFDEDGLKAVENVVQSYPEDGGIRIVPDKNELSGFKARMKTLGRYCALDLRKFPGENEKIRPNKNFGLGSERNAYIVYSDVITEISCDRVMQVLDAAYVFVGERITLRADRPASELVLVSRDGRISGPWRWEDAPDVVGCLMLTRATDRQFVALDEAEMQKRIIVLQCDDGEVVRLLIDPDEFNVAIPSQASPAQDAGDAPGESGDEKREIDAPCAAPVNSPLPAIAQPSVPAAPSPAEQPAQAPAAFPAEQTSPAEPPVENNVKPYAAPAANAGKPATDRGEMGKFRAILGRLDSQTGVNPRRGRSLAEVIDDQWRKSRFEQLGHPIPVDAMTKPVISPIDRAVAATLDAWSIPDARESLLQALTSNEELAAAMAAKLNAKPDAEKGWDDHRAIDIEAERLRLMTEIDALRARRTSIKAELMEDLRKAHINEFKKYEERNNAIKAELERNEAAAKSAQIAAEAAEQLLGKTAEQMEQHMLNHLMTQRAIELVMHMADKRTPPAQHPALYEPTAGELISDLRVQLDSAGFMLDNDDAVNILASMLTGGMAIISGPTGCGKSQLVRQLAAALGLSGNAKRFIEARDASDPRIEELIDSCDGLTPCVVMFDDVNLEENIPCVNRAIRLQEDALSRGLPLIIILTVQDAPDGLPLSARLLGRAFFIRLSAASTSSSWKPPKLLGASPDRAVSLSAIRDIFTPKQELEAEVESRLYRLREQLDAIGYTIDRRTLNELWFYCACVANTMRLSGIATLDRAIAQRALPAMLASMDERQLVELPRIICDLPRCMKL
ncbi:MAG: AAA family ATPase, partial [Clostridia bacterium]|nr:AAA family ATPase [Clostridia bacterium]